MPDLRRTYYDHEPAYRRIVEQGGRGWDDLHGPQTASDSYIALDSFLESTHFRSLPKPVHALDLGCGGGQGAIRLARCGCRVHGVDFAESAIALAQSNARCVGVQITFTVGDALTLADFHREQFDLVVDNHLLHCIIESSDRRALLASAARVLRPGGMLFSETMSAEGDLDFDGLDIDPLTRCARNRTRFWTNQHELRDLFASCGFAILAQNRWPQPHSPAAGELIVTIARREAGAYPTSDGG